ncbi:MAG: rod shape-determining protein RodA [Candidatus Levybacteria bacterium]|nr:rod shape-determining protein RodA [Candidatus Levybacteria bacterium]
MNKVFFAHIDWSLLVPVLILSILGLTTLFSINSTYFFSQLVFILFSLCVFLFVTNVDIQAARYFALPIYIVSFLILAFVLFLGIESRGAMRWVEVFGIRIQFSEILKPFLILSFAGYLSHVDKTSFKSFFLIVVAIVAIAMLIVIQPDLGSGLIYLGVAFFALVIFGFPLLWFLIGFVGFAALTPFLWHFLHDYQQRRIITFLSPSHDPLGISYNAIQSMIAVGSGGFLGKGLGEGTQSSLRFLPERHTDFIFATLSENSGFIGMFIIFLCFGVLLYRLYTIFSQTEDVFFKLVCLCTFLLILIQFFINAGMNMGIVPVVGVTLPFVSYGGSSVLSNFILLGIVSSISKNFTKPNALEIR